jgi:hypothetical protein
VYSSTHIDHPYSNTLVAREIILGVLNDTPRTLGEAILAAKHKLVAHPSDETTSMIDAVALFFVPHKDQKLNREDHVHLYNLLGDPALRIGRPRVTAGVTVPEAAAWGEPLPVKCVLSRPLEGTAVVTLEARRGEIFEKLARPSGATDAAALAVIKSNWAKANKSVIASARTSVSGKEFTLTLRTPTPGHRPDTYLVKVYVEGNDGAAMGSTSIALTAK